MLLLHLLLPALSLGCYDGCFKMTRFMHGLHNRYENLQAELKTCSEALAWTCEEGLECLVYEISTRANLTVHPEMDGDIAIQSFSEMVVEREYCGDATYPVEEMTCQGYGAGIADSLKETQDGSFSYTSEFKTRCSGPWRVEELAEIRRQEEEREEEKEEAWTDQGEMDINNIPEEENNGQEEDSEGPEEEDNETEKNRVSEKDVQSYVSSQNIDNGSPSLLQASTLLAAIFLSLL